MCKKGDQGIGSIWEIEGTRTIHETESIAEAPEAVGGRPRDVMYSIIKWIGDAPVRLIPKSSLPVPSTSSADLGD
jgi:hypothetical protein